MPPVKRNYDASRRQAQARDTRRRVLEVARARFLLDGYAATTVARIAADADVAPQTITKHFGNKPGLVRALFDVALVGDDDRAPLATRDWIIAIHQEPDARRKLRLYADTLVAMLPRTAPIQLLLREASAGTDAAIATVWAQIQAGRLMGMTDLARNLADGGHLRDDVSVDDARDVLWACSSPELYELFVLRRSWTPERYAGFLTSTTTAALLVQHVG